MLAYCDHPQKNIPITLKTYVYPLLFASFGVFCLLSGKNNAAQASPPLAFPRKAQE
jgi:hypothetical protein